MGALGNLSKSLSTKEIDQSEINQKGSFSSIFSSSVLTDEERQRREEEAKQQLKAQRWQEANNYLWYARQRKLILDGSKYDTATETESLTNPVNFSQKRETDRKFSRNVPEGTTINQAPVKQKSAVDVAKKWLTNHTKDTGRMQSQYGVELDAEKSLNISLNHFKDTILRQEFDIAQIEQQMKEENVNKVIADASMAFETDEGMSAINKTHWSKKVQNLEASVWFYEYMNGESEESKKAKEKIIEFYKKYGDKMQMSDIGKGTKFLTGAYGMLYDYYEGVAVKGTDDIAKFGLAGAMYGAMAGQPTIGMPLDDIVFSASGALGGAMVGGQVAISKHFFTLGTGMAYAEMKEAGVRESIATNMAGLAGLVEGALEVAQLKFAGKVGKKVIADFTERELIKKVGQNAYLQMTKEFGKGWISEALEEGAQGISTQLISNIGKFLENNQRLIEANGNEVDLIKTLEAGEIIGMGVEETIQGMYATWLFPLGGIGGQMLNQQRINQIYNENLPAIMTKAQANAKKLGLVDLQNLIKMKKTLEKTYNEEALTPKNRKNIENAQEEINFVLVERKQEAQESTKKEVKFFDEDESAIEEEFLNEEKSIDDFEGVLALEVTQSDLDNYRIANKTGAKNVILKRLKAGDDVVEVTEEVAGLLPSGKHNLVDAKRVINSVQKIDKEIMLQSWESAIRNASMTEAVKKMNERIIEMTNEGIDETAEGEETEATEEKTETKQLEKPEEMALPEPLDINNIGEVLEVPKNKVVPDDTPILKREVLDYNGLEGKINEKSFNLDNEEALVWESNDGDLILLNGKQQFDETEGNMKVRKITEQEFSKNEAYSIASLARVMNGEDNTLDSLRIIKTLNLDEEQLKSFGVDTNKPTVKRAIKLSELADPLYTQVMTKSISLGKAEAILDHSENESEQIANYKVIIKEEAQGQRFTIPQVKKLLDQVNVQINRELTDEQQARIKEAGDKAYKQVMSKKLSAWGTSDQKSAGRMRKRSAERSRQKEEKYMREKIIDERVKKASEVVSREQAKRDKAKNKRERKQYTNFLDEATQNPDINQYVVVDVKNTDIQQMEASIARGHYSLEDVKEVLAIADKYFSEDRMEFMRDVLGLEQTETQEEFANQPINVTNEGDYKNISFYDSVGGVIEKAQNNAYLNNVEITLQEKQETVTFETEQEKKEAGYNGTETGQEYQKTGESLFDEKRPRILLYKGASKDTISEEIVHVLQRRLKFIDPDLEADILDWHNNVVEQSRRLGFEILMGDELFAQAFVFTELGHADQNPDLANILSIDDDIVTRFKEILGEELFEEMRGETDPMLSKDQRLLKGTDSTLSQKVIENLDNRMAVIDDVKQHVENYLNRNDDFGTFFSKFGGVAEVEMAGESYYIKLSVDGNVYDYYFASSTQELSDTLGDLGFVYNHEMVLDEITKQAKVQFQLKDDVDLGVHFGDLGVGWDTSLYNMAYDRGTGHFGTATYFLGKDSPYMPEGVIKGRPINFINLSRFNLFRPRNKDRSFDLHDAFKYANRLVRIYTEEMHQKVLSAIENPKTKYPANQLINWIDLKREYEKDIQSLEDQYYKEEINDEEFDERYKEITEEFEKNDEVFELASQMIEKLREGVQFTDLDYEFNDEGLDYYDLFKEALESVREINKDFSKTGYLDKRRYSMTSFANRFLGKLGYDGIDVRGYPLLDNFSYGSTIFSDENANPIVTADDIVKLDEIKPSVEGIWQSGLFDYEIRSLKQINYRKNMQRSTENIDTLTGVFGEGTEVSTIKDYYALKDSDDRKDLFISNNFIDAIPQDYRNEVVLQMARKLKTEGKMILTVRENPFDENVEWLDQENQEGLLEDNQYRKKFTIQELRYYLLDILPAGFRASTLKQELDGSIGVEITKTAVATYDELVRETRGQYQLKPEIDDNGMQLFATHNLWTNELMKMLEIRGFPVPSIAVFPSNNYVGRIASSQAQSFGENIVLFNSDTIDPQKDQRNDVFNTDVYTSYFPNAGKFYTFDLDQTKRYLELLSKYDIHGEIEQLANSTFMKHTQWQVNHNVFGSYKGKMLEEPSNVIKILDQLNKSTALRLFFLEEQGVLTYQEFANDEQYLEQEQYNQLKNLYIYDDEQSKAQLYFDVFIDQQVINNRSLKNAVTRLQQLIDDKNNIGDYDFTGEIEEFRNIIGKMLHDKILGGGILSDLNRFDNAIQSEFDAEENEAMFKKFNWIKEEIDKFSNKFLEGAENVYELYDEMIFRVTQDYHDINNANDVRIRELIEHKAETHFNQEFGEIPEFQALVQEIFNDISGLGEVDLIEDPIADEYREFTLENATEIMVKLQKHINKGNRLTKHTYDDITDYSVEDIIPRFLERYNSIEAIKKRYQDHNLTEEDFRKSYKDYHKIINDIGTVFSRLARVYYAKNEFQLAGEFVEALDAGKSYEQIINELRDDLTTYAFKDKEESLNEDVTSRFYIDRYAFKRVFGWSLHDEMTDGLGAEESDLADVRFEQIAQKELAYYIDKYIDQLREEFDYLNNWVGYYAEAKPIRTIGFDEVNTIVLHTEEAKQEVLKEHGDFINQVGIDIYTKEELYGEGGKTRENILEVLRKTGKQFQLKIPHYNFTESSEMGTLSYPETVRKANLPEEFETLLQHKEYQYAVKKNINTMLSALKYLSDVGIDQAVDDVLDPNNSGTAELFALAHAVVAYKIDAGEVERAEQILEAVSLKAKNLGQAIQILSLWNRMTPQGIVRYAKKVVSGSMTESDIKKIARESEEVARIMRIINKEVVDNVDIIEKIKEITGMSDGDLILEQFLNQWKEEHGEKEAGERTAEEILAEKIMKETEEKTETQKTPLEVMVDTLFDLAKETIPENEMVREDKRLEFVATAIKQRAEYRQVWERAKEIVEEKLVAQDRVEAMADLEQYFEQAINRTFPDQKLKGVIKKELRNMEVKIREIVKKHYTQNSNVRDTLVDKLVNEAGLTGIEADLLEKHIRRQMKDMTKQAKEKTLNSIFTKTEQQERKDITDKIIELSNLGAFKHNKYKSLVADKLGLPSLPPEAIELIHAQAQKIQTMEEGREKDIAVAKMMRMINRYQKVTFLEKIDFVQTLSQLLNLKTMGRNIIGNLGFASVDTYLTGSIRPFIDYIYSQSSGRRTAKLMNVKKAQASWEGLKSGWEKGLYDVMNRIDTADHETRFDFKRTRTFEDGVLGTLETWLSVGLRATDRAFYESAVRESLAEMIEIYGEDNLTEEMYETAHMMGLYRTFQDDTLLARNLVALKRKLNAKKGFGAGSMLLKYPKTPANLLMRGIDYSPVGVIFALLKLYRDNTQNEYLVQRMRVDAISRSITGTALLSAGYILYKLGVITKRKDDEDDYDIYSIKMNTGVREFQVNLSMIKRLTVDMFTQGLTNGDVDQLLKTQEGDLLVTYDWYQPLSIVIGMGADIGANQGVGGFATSLFSAIEAGQESLTSQPLLANLHEALQQETLTGMLRSALMQVPNSFIPTLLSQVQTLYDPTVYQTYYRDEYFNVSMNRAYRKMPFIAGKKLEPMIGRFGDITQYYDPSDKGWLRRTFESFVAPYFADRYEPSANEKLVLDLYEATQENRHAPRQVEGTYRVELPDGNKYDIKLTPREYRVLSEWVGQTIDERFTQLREGGLQNYSDEQQVKILYNAINDVHAELRYRLKRMVMQKELGQVELVEDTE